MQEIVYEDGKKTKKKFKSILVAIADAEEKAKQRQIKSIKISRVIPSKKKTRRS